MLQLDGKTVVITGGGSGIGRAASIKFASVGARVAVADIKGVLAVQTAEEIRSFGGEAVAIEVDVTAADQVQRMVAQTVQAFGSIDILYNNAIWYPRCNVVEMTEEEWDLTINVGLKAIFLTAKHTIPLMVTKGQGVIINTSSIHAKHAFPKHAGYAAVKAGILGLTRQLAVEYGSSGIRVNAIIPGAVDTALLGSGETAEIRKSQLRQTIPLGRIGTPDDIANAAIFLASDMASFITGTSLTVDGGFTAGKI